MISKIHIFLSRYVVRPFYSLNIWPFSLIGEIMREILVFIFKCDISPKAKIPFSTVFTHYIGIVIGSCEIGHGCIIRQNTTIGKKSTKKGISKFPKIGNNVEIGANVCIIGDINIGSNSIIGAGSVVVSDVEPNSVYAGVPAKKISCAGRKDG